MRVRRSSGTPVFQDSLLPQGYVEWELVDSRTNKVRSSGTKSLGQSNWKQLLSRLPLLDRLSILGIQNGIVNHARKRVADSIIGTSVTVPNFVGVGTGTNPVSATDTGLQTVSQYDSSNDAKQCASRTKKDDYTARFVTQFLTTEANITIRELGLFEANNASQNMWARVAVNITKTSTDRLNIFWYITFQRRQGLAIKTGTSIEATGVITQNVVSTATFASAVTVFRLNNYTAGIIFAKLNGALDHNTAPTNFDYKLAAGTSIELLDEQIEISTVSLSMAAATVTLGSTATLTIVGW